MECLWTLCSLSVYPLYYVYICSLVSRPIAPLKLFLLFLPGILIAAARYPFSGEALDYARKILFTVQVLVVLFFGFRKSNCLFYKYLIFIYFYQIMNF